jgi:SAM-dependent methyltransferase
MRLTTGEKLLIRSPLRAYMLRRLEAPRVLSNLDIGERSVCLDIGCGSGVGALLINQYLDCEKVVGIDIDPDMVTAAEEYVSHPPKWARNIRTDNIEFLCEDATSPTFPDYCFDAVFLFGVLHHIKGWKKLISEVYRILKVGGVFSFSEETLLPDFIFRFGKPGLDAAYKLFGGTPISEGELKATLEKSGFSIRRFEKILSACLVRATKAA